MSGPPAGAEGSRNEPVPLTLTNGKTQASAGTLPPARRRRTVVWVALGLCAVAVAGAKGLGFLGAPMPSEPAANVGTAEPVAAAPAPEPLAPLPTAAPAPAPEPTAEPVASQEAPPPPSSAEAPVAPPTGLPKAPLAAQLKPPVAAMPARAQLNWANVPRPTAKPVAAPSAAQPPAKPSGVSDFGGRK